MRVNANMCVLMDDAFRRLSFFSMKFASTSERHYNNFRVPSLSVAPKIAVTAFLFEDIITLFSNLLHVRKVTYSLLAICLGGELGNWFARDYR